MSEPLSVETLARMRADHAGMHWCLACETVPPCDAALLLAELDRREANPPRWQGRQPVPHLALLVGHVDALFGPRSAEDLC